MAATRCLLLVVALCLASVMCVCVYAFVCDTILNIYILFGERGYGRGGNNGGGGCGGIYAYDAGVVTLSPARRCLEICMFVRVCVRSSSQRTVRARETLYKYMHYK